MLTVTQNPSHLLFFSEYFFYFVDDSNFNLKESATFSTFIHFNLSAIQGLASHALQSIFGQLL